MAIIDAFYDLFKVESSLIFAKALLFYNLVKEFTAYDELTYEEYFAVGCKDLCIRTISSAQLPISSREKYIYIYFCS